MVVLTVLITTALECLEVWDGNLSHVILSAEDCLRYWTPFLVPYEFQDFAAPPISVKNTVRILIALNLQMAFGRIFIFTTVTI